VGGPLNQFDTQARHFAARGMVAVQVEYRLLGKDNEPPTTCIEDARSAMRWVRAHAKDLGVDPARIASAGGSAGGHLAAFVGMCDGVDDPKDDRKISAKSNAMVLFNPVFDNGPGGWGYARTGTEYKKFSPAHNVSADDPPAIVFLGSADKLIPAATLEKFKADMTQAGVRCETFVYDGQEHGFFNRDPWRTKTLMEADAFLVSLGWLKPAVETGGGEPLMDANRR
jgi:acetyl esterase